MFLLLIRFGEMRRKFEYVFFGTAAVRIMYPTLASANTGKYFPALLGFFKLGSTQSICSGCTVILDQPMNWCIPCQACPQLDSEEFKQLCNPFGPGKTHSRENNIIWKFLSNVIFIYLNYFRQISTNALICTNGVSKNLVGTSRFIASFPK